MGARDLSGVLPYDGTTSHQAWLKHLTRLARARDWDDEAKLRVAIIALKGPVLAWFDGLRLDEDKLTWAEFVERLDKKYSYRSYDWDYELRRIEKARSLREYVTLFRDLNDKFPSAVPDDEERLREFMRGLYGPDRANVQYRRPATLAEALDAAEELTEIQEAAASREGREAPRPAKKEFPARAVEIDALAAEKRLISTPFGGTKRREVTPTQPHPIPLEEDPEPATTTPPQVAPPSTRPDTAEGAKIPPPAAQLPKAAPERIPPLAPIGLSAFAEPYSIAEDLLGTPAHISLGQLLIVAPHLRRDLNQNLTRLPKPTEVLIAAKEASKRIPIEVGTALTYAIVDSGSDLSLISANLVEELGLIPTPKTDISLIMANEESHQPHGQVQTLLRLPGQSEPFPWNLLVIDAHRYDILLGSDWLEHFQVVVNHGKKTLEFQQDGQTLEVDMMSRNQTLEGSSALLVEWAGGTPEDPSTTVPTERLAEIIASAKDLFVEDLKEAPGTDLVCHSIHVTDDRPVSCRPYRMGPADLRILDDLLDDMLAKGVIVPSSAPYAFPVVLAEKEDGRNGKRFCVNYKKLNAKTIRDVMPLPRQDDLLDRFAGCVIFSHLDLHSGFWQVRMNPADVPKTTFTTYRGNHAFRVMPFGLTNAPATFQRLMNSVLQPCLGRFVEVYLDDIIIYSRTIEEHLSHLTSVFDLLRRAQLRMKRAKCRFGESELIFLGHRVGKDGVGTDPAKCLAIREAPTPKSMPQLRSFLGLASYYRRFVQNFAEIATPLHFLLRKGVPWAWGPDQQVAFDTLREFLSDPPVLAHPQFDQPFLVYTDASDYALGAVLAQDSELGERPVAYLSRGLSDAERNYTTTEKECLSAVVALKRWKPYLQAAKLTLFTDHAALLYLLNHPSPTGRLARWYFELSQFSLEVRHRPGKGNVVADYLSRNTPLEVYELTVGQGPADTLALARVALSGKDAPDGMASGQWRTLRKKYFLDPLGRLMKRRSLNKHVPVIEDPTMRQRYLQIAHERYGHLGVNSTYKLLAERLWWPDLYRDCKTYVLACHSCQVHSREPPEFVPPARVPDWQRLECLAVDYLGPMPPSATGKVYMIVAVDQASRFPWARATQGADANSTRDFLLELFSLVGAPKAVLTDNGRHFRNAAVEATLAAFGVVHYYTPTYHPQSNGRVERLNAVILQGLRKMTQGAYSDWERHLPKVLMGIRMRVHETTGVSPYELLYGMTGRMGFEPRDAQRLPAIAPPETTSPFSHGDLVLVRVPGRPSGKLAKTYDGPYAVLEETRTNVFTLVDPEAHEPCLQNVHADRMKSYRGPEDGAAERGGDRVAG